MRKPSAVLAASVVLGLLATGPLRAATASHIPPLVAYAEKAAAEWQVPGIAIGIIRDGRIAWVGGLGVRTIGSPDAVDGDTRFPVGSVTKTFTAAGIAQLVSEEKLKWDDPLTNHLPGLAFANHELTRGLTVRDALGQRTGLPTSNNSLLRYVPPAELARRMQHVTPAAPMRSQFTYNNQMYVLLGLITETVAERPWSTFMTERLFAPLGMSRTSVTPLPAGGNDAAGHASLGDVLHPVSSELTVNYAPAGAIVSSARDLSQWLLAFLSGAAGEVGVLDPAAIRIMHGPSIFLPLGAASERMFPSTHFSAYGLGWFMRDYQAIKLVEHGGNVRGFSAQVALIPEKKAGLVVLTNADSSLLPRAVMFRFVDELVGAEPRDWSTLFLEQRRAGEAAAAKARAGHPELASLTRDDVEFPAGIYTHPLYGEMQVKLESGEASVWFNPSTTGTLMSDTAGQIFVKWDDPFVHQAVGPTRVRYEVSETEHRLTFDGIATYTRGIARGAGRVDEDRRNSRKKER